MNLTNNVYVKDATNSNSAYPTTPISITYIIDVAIFLVSNKPNANIIYANANVSTQLITMSALYMGFFDDKFFKSIPLSN